MDNITDKDKETRRLITEIRETAEKLYSLSIEWKNHTNSNWWLERNTYQGACSEIINVMERLYIKKFGLEIKEIYPEYDEPVEKLEVGKSYWAWVSHSNGEGSEEIKVVSRDGKKIYAKFYGAYDDVLIAVGEVTVNTSMENGCEVTYEEANFTWVTNRGYEYRGEIAGWDIVK